MNLTFLLRAYAKYRNNYFKKSPLELQEQQLFKLLQTAKDTQFGQQYQFDNIKSIEDYQNTVPLRKYEDFWSEYWQNNYPIVDNITWPGKIPYFAVSSGTTSGATKYLPLTKAMANSNTKAGLDLLVHHFNNFPNSKILEGKCFFLGGSTDLVKEAEDVFSGDLSGMVTKDLAWFAKPFYFPSKEMATVSNWEEKIDIFAKESVKQKIKMLSGVPSWMLIFIDKLFQNQPNIAKKILNIYPDLEVIVHGGVNFSPYENTFRKLTEGSNIQFREVYPASEGFIAIADRGSGAGLKLNLDHGIFYEFVPLDELANDNPTRHWIGNVQPNINYAIILTTCSGVWSYIIGDTVKFVDTKNARILVTGRTSYSLSAFGEHLIEEELQKGIYTAANDINKEVRDFTVFALYPDEQEKLGGHQYIVEFNEEITNSAELTRFTDILDRKLIELNEDYEAHRADGFGIRKPIVKAVAAGFFESWMKARGKHGGQNKVPRVINNSDLINSILKHS